MVSNFCTRQCRTSWLEKDIVNLFVPCIELVFSFGKTALFQFPVLFKVVFMCILGYSYIVTSDAAILLLVAELIVL